jgi:hypothetical protein
LRRSSFLLLPISLALWMVICSWFSLSPPNVWFRVCPTLGTQCDM